MNFWSNSTSGTKLRRTTIVGERTSILKPHNRFSKLEVAICDLKFERPDMAQKFAIIERTIASRIFFVRQKRVILDQDLALLYGVNVKRLNEQVKRNKERFPEDFLFHLTQEEFENLRSQFATSSSSSQHGGRRYAPFAFTEHGAVMAATILNSPRAVEMSVFVVRAFVRLRDMLTRHDEIATRFSELEKRLDSHDESIQTIVKAIRSLMEPPPRAQRRIGFRSVNEDQRRSKSEQRRILQRR